jgi:L-asparaginase type I
MPNSDPRNVTDLKSRLIELGILSEQDWCDAEPSIEDVEGVDELENILQALVRKSATWADPSIVHITVLTEFQADEIRNGREDELRFASYVLLDRLGAGAMGEVFLCRELPPLDRPVALKMLKADHPDEEARHRFEQEANVLAKIKHETIPAVYNFGWRENRPYIVMDYISGLNLREEVSKRKANGVELEIDDVVRWGIRIAEGLRAGHAKGVVHRDVKPGNIMISAGGPPKLLDFGLAQVLDRTLTPNGLALGTPAYMAPEQWDAAAKVTPAADIYGLGATLYYALVGAPPFDGGIYELKEAHCTKGPPPPSQKRVDVDNRLDQIVVRMLAKRPEDRYSDDELINELKHYNFKGPSSRRRAKAKPDVCFMTCGGAMTMRRDSNGRLNAPDLTPQGIIDAVPRVFKMADLVPVDLMRKDSTDMVPSDWTTITDEIKKRMDEFDAFVITHGTDTMAYTAGAIALAFGRGLKVPVVLTGAHLPLADPGSDALFNLENAIRAAAVACREKVAEVMISFGHKVIRGCRARKRSDFEFDAFESPCLAPLATLGYEIRFGEHVFKRRSTDDLMYRPRFREGVYQLRLAPGIHEDHLREVLSSQHLIGLVLESFGTSGVPTNIRRLIADARIPVVVTKTHLGRHLRFEKEAAESLRAVGAVLAGDMTSEMAAVKLMWLAAQSCSGSVLNSRLLHPEVGEITSHEAVG